MPYDAILGAGRSPRSIQRVINVTNKGQASTTSTNQLLTNFTLSSLPVMLLGAWVSLNTDTTGDVTASTNPRVQLYVDGNIVASWQCCTDPLAQPYWRPSEFVTIGKDVWNGASNNVELRFLSDASTSSYPIVWVVTVLTLEI